MNQPFPPATMKIGGIGDALARTTLGLVGTIMLLWPVLFPQDGWRNLPGFGSMSIGFLLLLACAFFNRVIALKAGSAGMELASPAVAVLPPEVAAPAVPVEQLQLPELETQTEAAQSSIPSLTARALRR